MTHVLVFDSDCGACSRAARAVAEMGIEGLEVRGLSDPVVVARLREARLEPPAGPALLSGEGPEATLRTGWWMRVSLARLVGWRRGARIVRLVSIEARARASRGAGSVSRRRVLGAGLAAAAGAVTSAILPEAASAAAAAPATGLKPAADADVQRALGGAAVRTAVRTWGAVHPAGVASDGTTSVLVLGFADAPDVALLVDNADSGTAVAVRNDPAGGVLQFFGVDGTAFGSVSVVAGRVVATAAPAAPPAPAAAATGAVPAVHIPTAKIRCFLHCLGAHLKADCILTCHTCATTPNPFSRVVACAHCLICAGPEAIRCAKHCF